MSQTKSFLSVLVLFLVTLNGCLLDAPSESDMTHNADKDMRPGLAVPVLEPTQGDWVNDNTWGDQYSGVMPQSAGQELQVLKNTNFYGPPAVHTVNLFRSDKTPILNADIYAHIRYGVGGVQNDFYCDWGQGVQFSLPVNSLTIGAVTYAPNADSGYRTGDAHVFFGAMVAKGSSGQAAPLTLTEAAQTFPAAGAPVHYDVPDFAVGLRVYSIPAINDPAALTNVSVILATGFSLETLDAQAFARGNTYPLPGGTLEVIVQNNGGADRFLILQWVLAL